MICSYCNAEKKEEDFLSNRDICYKCQYGMKVKKKDKFCRICKAKVPKGNWAFCSKECSEIGGIKQKQLYWTKLVKS